MTKRMFKRGMSPIIATVLLIAFAVSIGATVMSLGGIYYEKIRLEDASCSKVLINAFDLDNGRECRNYEHKSILNFYPTGKGITAPKCYSEVATGKVDICATSDAFLNSSWTPISFVIS